MEDFERKNGKGGYSPSINLVLRNFQATAERSLSGPTDLNSSLTVGFENVANNLGRLVYPAVDRRFRSESTHGPQKKQTLSSLGSYSRNDNQFQSFLQTPLLLAQDSSVTETTETVLEGETITCFVVGGEKRLCMPEVLKKVLNCFELSQIHLVYEELNIFTSLCSTLQLYTLKCQGILPASAATCGLITKTDAERLCSTLLRRNGDVVNGEPASAKAIRVTHQCFGKCDGVFHLDLFKSTSSRAVQCSECGGMFSPPEFVCHAHHALENRTCHWGFDSSKWRHYVKVSKEEKSPRAKRLLDRAKLLFEKEESGKGHRLSDDDDSVVVDVSDSVDNNINDDDHDDVDDKEEVITFKRPRYDDRSWNLKFQPKSFHVSSLSSEPKRDKSPVLLQPHHNISFEQQQQQQNRNDRYFAPNVSLTTPESYKKELLLEIESKTYHHPHDFYVARSRSHSHVQSVQFQQRLSRAAPSHNVTDCSKVQPLPPFRGRQDQAEFQPLPPFSRNGRDRPAVVPGGHIKDLKEKYIVTEMELSQLWRLEIDMLNSALESSASESKDRVINDYIGIQKRHLSLATKLIVIQHSLEQELRKLNGQTRMKEEEEILNRLEEKEFENILITNKRKLQETEEENLRLRSEIEAIVNGSKRSDIGLMKAKYKAQVEHFKRKLQSSEQQKESNLRKLFEMHETLRQRTTTTDNADPIQLSTSSSSSLMKSPSAAQ